MTRRQPRTSLVQIMACLLFGVKPLSEPMLEYCQSHRLEQTSVNFYWQFRHFHPRTCIWKCRLKNGGHFFSASLCKFLDMHPNITIRMAGLPNEPIHDDVIKWKHFPRYWPIVRGIHRSPVNSPHNGQWRGALIFTLICVWINGWVNNCEAGHLRCYHAHYDVSVMSL